mgnify:CR=1 FL=1
MRQNDDDPVEQIKDDLLNYWGEENDQKPVLWDLYLRAGMN